MLMPPALRKAVLTLHVGSSVGALGAVAAFLVLAAAGALSQEPHVLAMAYPAMELLASGLIIPLLAGSLVIGVLQSLGTPWGLFRHYWVVAKLVLNVAVLIVLLLQLPVLHLLARAAAEGTIAAPALRLLRFSPVVHAGAGLAVLLLPLLLSIYKPRGLTRYGWRRQHGARARI
jgi:hypothetical protein